MVNTSKVFCARKVVFLNCNLRKNFLKTTKTFIYKTNVYSTIRGYLERLWKRADIIEKLLDMTVARGIRDSPITRQRNSTVRYQIYYSYSNTEPAMCQLLRIDSEIDRPRRVLLYSKEPASKAGFQDKNRILIVKWLASRLGSGDGNYAKKKSP